MKWNGYIYGFAAATGNNTYGTTYGIVYSPTLTKQYFTGVKQSSTIKDDGGIDIFDLSKYTGAGASVNGVNITGAKIDLRKAIDASDNWLGGSATVAGNVTIVGDEYIYIARGTHIENAKGTAKDDIIYGNDAQAADANHPAFDGNNRLEGGKGNDIINGGGGVDTAVYGGTTAITLNVKAVAADASRFASVIELSANGNIDRIIGVEKVELSSVDDIVIISKDPKIPFPANVVFDGGAGIDTLTYDGNGVTASILEVASASETLATGAKKELISNIETILGTAGADRLNIGLLVNTNVQTIDAGGGDDTIWVFGSVTIPALVAGSQEAYSNDNYSTKINLAA